MKRVIAITMSVAFLAAFSPLAEAQTKSCPPEVATAKAMLSKQTARAQDVQAPRSLAGARGKDAQAARGQDVQAPRGREAQAARGQDVQAPRGQDVQAPRGQDVQAPRGQDVQAPRGQDVQAPRGQDVQAPRGQSVQTPRSSGTQAASSSKAASLVKQAEAACKAGDMTTAKAKAEEAIAAMK